MNMEISNIYIRLSSPFLFCNQIRFNCFIDENYVAIRLRVYISIFFYHVIADGIVINLLLSKHVIFFPPFALFNRKPIQCYFS